MPTNMSKFYFLKLLNNIKKRKKGEKMSKNRTKYLFQNTCTEMIE